MVLDRRMFRRPSQIAPNKGPSSKGVGITSGLTQPVQKFAKGDFVEKFKEARGEILADPSLREAFPKSDSFYERAGMSPFQFFAALGSPMQPGQTVLGKIGEAGQYLDIKPIDDPLEDFATEVGLTAAAKTLEDEEKYKAASPTGKAKQDYLNGAYGEVGSPAALNLYLAELERLNKSDRTYRSPEEELKIVAGTADIENLQENVKEAEDLLTESFKTSSQVGDIANQALSSLDQSASGSFANTRTNIAGIVDFLGIQELNPDLYNRIQTTVLGEGANLAATEATNSLEEMLALIRAEYLPSNLNNQEVAILKNSGPQLFYTKEGQRLILNLLKARADLDAQKLEAFNNFKNTGKLSYMGDDGEEVVLLESPISDLTGRPTLAEQENALALIDTQLGKVLGDRITAGYRDQINEISNVQGAYTDSFFKDLPAQFKQIEGYGGVEELNRDNRLLFVGYSDPEGNFSYDAAGMTAPVQFKTVYGKTPVYMAIGPDGKKRTLIDFEKYVRSE